MLNTAQAALRCVSRLNHPMNSGTARNCLCFVRGVLRRLLLVEHQRHLETWSKKSSFPPVFQRINGTLPRRPRRAFCRTGHSLSGWHSSCSCPLPVVRNSTRVSSCRCPLLVSNIARAIHMALVMYALLVAHSACDVMYLPTYTVALLMLYYLPTHVMSYQSWHMKIHRGRARAGEGWERHADRESRTASQHGSNFCSQLGFLHASRQSGSCSLHSFV